MAALLKGYENYGLNIGDVESYHIDRLISLGLFENFLRLSGEVFLSAKDTAWERGSSNAVTEGKSNSKDVMITKLGKLYCECGLVN